jgi:hypothetical protein
MKEYAKMKKYNIFFLFSMVLSVFFLLAGCGKDNQSGEKLAALIPEEITEITVTHILSGKETEYTIDGAKLDELKLWASNLSMKYKVYKDGSTPGDVDGGEVYGFNMEDNYTEFSYIINGEKECYVLVGDKWYVISNPTDPFEEGELESYTNEDQIKWDRIPMVMVEDALYLDTGKQISAEIHDSAIIGAITSKVDATEIPSENAQSNFGCIGSEYAFYKDGIVVMMNNEWQFFRREKIKLSLDVVTELAQKKDSLSWDDFEKYDSIDVGSGLYILRYDIDDNFYLLIGGGSKDQNPMYIRLVRANSKDDYIDIRTDDVENFISK